MLSRRHFLVSSGTVLLTTVAGGRQPVPESRLHACVIVTPDLPRCCTFETVPQPRGMQIQIDSGDYLAEFTEILDTRAPQLIVGFTPHSDFIVLSQLAYERGFTSIQPDLHACPAGHRLLSWAFHRDARI